mgnify:CR=1 FL=1
MSVSIGVSVRVAVSGKVGVVVDNSVSVGVGVSVPGSCNNCLDPARWFCSLYGAVCPANAYCDKIIVKMTSDTNNANPA